jgi:predicted amidophosphoribosyltransferase
MVRLGAFGGDLADWIRSIKYRRWEPMGVALGALLGEATRRVLAGGAAPPVVVPMPMPLIRRLQRGIDHTATIAAGVASALRCPIARPLVHAGGPPQVTLSASQRRQRTAPVALRRYGLFRGRISGRTVVLVDDVTTTGTTLRAAARLLRSLGPSAVVAGVLAVADRPADDLA